MDISNENKEKLKRYLSFLEQDPNNFNLLISISDSYRQLGDFAAAQLYLDKAKEIDSQACLAQQGFLNLNLGHFQEAKEALQKALLREDLPIIRYALAVCHYSQQELTEGIEVLSPLLSKGDSSYEVELLMANLLYHSNRHEEAIKSLETTLENHGPAEQGLALLAQLYFEIEEMELAENTAQQALIISPKNYDAQVIMLLIKLAEGTTTVKEIKKLLNKNNTDSRLWFALGTTQLRTLKLQAAEKSFLKAAELEPLFHDNWISLGWCQLSLNKVGEAHASYYKAIDAHEESSEAWGGLAIVTALNSDFVGAEQMIQKAKKLDSECFLADIAQIIYSNYSAPAQAAKQFKKTFPTIAEQINAAMAIVLSQMENPSTIIH